jgi:hypothetical protein
MYVYNTEVSKEFSANDLTGLFDLNGNNNP